MADPLPQPPPMAYKPQHGEQSLSPAVLSALQSQRLQSTQAQQSFSSASTGSSTLPVSSSPRKSSSPDSHRALGVAVSEKSSFSSTSSAASSPIHQSYSPAVQSALQNSCRSSTSSHQSVLASQQAMGGKPGRDLEKQPIPARNTRHTTERARIGHHYESTYGHADEEDDDDLKVEDKAMSILLYLSLPNVLISLAILFYTLFALLATILLQPYKLISGTSSFSHQLIAFLAPTLRKQLSLIHSSHDSDQFSAPMLVLVNLFSPVMSFGVAGAAWVAAAFWFFNGILGDPTNTDKPKGYNDGRASVMGVRKWWEKWLRRPLR